MIQKADYIANDESTTEVLNSLIADGYIIQIITPIVEDGYTKGFYIIMSK